MASIPIELLASLEPPRPSQLVHREECTQCFDTIYSLGELGLDVCLTCFNGSCPSASQNQHSLLHADKTGHGLVVNIVKRRKPLEKRNKRDSQEPPIKKLAIRQEPTEEEKFETITRIKLFNKSNQTWEELNQEEEEVPDKVKSVVQGVLNSMSSAQKSEVEAWEEEIVPCVHTKELIQQEPLKDQGSINLKHCSECEMTSNLWLCLTCGNLGCGRQQFGGGGGNGHGVKHTLESKGHHSVAVKLGTIEPDGSADVYCYACDDARTDPDLVKHLSTFSIKVDENIQKTEKSMTELQVEQNMKFDFSLTDENGKTFEPVFGPGLTGFKNLGNSCYLASTLQSLFSLPNFQDRYLTSFFTHTLNCTRIDPANCFECQMSKIADGLLSGRYSKPASPQSQSQEAEDGGKSESHTNGDDEIPRFQEGLKPSMFKNLVGKDHSEFSTMRQQDAGEFLFHLLEFIKRSSKKENTESNSVTQGLFGFELEEKLQCTNCKGVRYKKQNQEGLSLPVPIRTKTKEKESSSSMEVDDGGQIENKKKKEEKEEESFQPVELLECFTNLTEPQSIEYSCSNCQEKTLALKSTRFRSFPQVLILNANRFQLENWVPKKVNVPLLFDPKEVDLSEFIGKGLQEGEKELPQDDQAQKGPIEHEFDQTSIDQLTGMGFPEIRAKRALLKTGNSGAEPAMNWLFEHMDDQDLDDPLPPPPQSSSSTSAEQSSTNEPSEETISMIMDMGFTRNQGRKALLETGNDPNRAVEWLFSHPDDDGTTMITETSASSSTTSNSNENKNKSESLGSNLLPAKYRLKSFISHKGPSVHSGHYVSHVWTGQADKTGQGKGSWVLFNDEKVVRAGGGGEGDASSSKVGDGSAEEWMEKAYVYLFERVEQ